jgi:hypothetical protein
VLSRHIRRIAVDKVCKGHLHLTAPLRLSNEHYSILSGSALPTRAVANIRRFRAARRNRWQHPRIHEAANLTPIFDPTLDPNIRLGPSRLDEDPRKSRLGRAFSDITRHPDMPQPP